MIEGARKPALERPKSNGNPLGCLRACFVLGYFRIGPSCSLQLKEVGFFLELVI